MYFDELNLNDNVLDALYDMHFDQCTPVQELCIPHILKGKDILAVAQTGTGKTAAYLLPILSNLADGGYSEDAINCVIMSPTRELAQQIDQAMQGFAYYLNGVSCVAVYGGNDGNRYDQEIKSLSLGADVIIATPGRFISHISLGNVDLSKVSFFVLDEADRMLDMGFSEDIKTIAKKLPNTCQTIMFSATMPAKIEELAKSLLKNPAIIKLAVSKPAEKIQQSAYVCYEAQKIGIIKDIFRTGDLKRVIIFSGSKQKVKQIASSLNRKNINCGEMHSDLDQAQRDDVMFKFKSGQIDVLVATDIVARGIDIDDIAMVINYDVPHDVEDYVHRIGRTARADREGCAITFINEDDMFYFQQIEKFLEKTINKLSLPEGLGEAPEYKIKKWAEKNGRRNNTTKSKRQKHGNNDAMAHSKNDQPIAPEKGKKQNHEKREAVKHSEEAVSLNEKPISDKGTQNRNEHKSSKGKGSNTKRKDNSTLSNQKETTAQSNKSDDNKQAANYKRGDRVSHRNNFAKEEKAIKVNSKSNISGKSTTKDENPKNKEGNKIEGNQPKHNNKRNKNKKRPSPKAAQEQRSTKYDIREGVNTSYNKETGLKAIFKKPLKWLKSLSKK